MRVAKGWWIQGGAEHKVCVLDGRGSQRATWGHLGPGHLGAQGASVVRVVDYCNEQIHPNPPEKSQITTCSKAKAMPPRVRPVPLLLISGCGAECRHCCVALPGGTGGARGLPVLQHSCSVLGRGFVPRGGRDAAREQRGSSRACREAVQSCWGSTAPPCPP